MTLQFKNIKMVLHVTPTLCQHKLNSVKNVDCCFSVLLNQHNVLNVFQHQRLENVSIILKWTGETHVFSVELFFVAQKVFLQLILGNWTGVSRGFYYLLFFFNTNIDFSQCLFSKSVVSHTQASSKNGLFNLTQVMTAGCCCFVAQSFNPPLQFSSQPVLFMARMDASTGRLNLKRKPFLVLPCCHHHPFSPSV